MTKREPFARFESNGIVGDSEYATLVVGERRILIMLKLEATARAKEINAAFEKAVREAVEEFRERAAKHIRRECMACEGSGRMPGMETECEYCGRPRDAIYALPVDGK